MATLTAFVVRESSMYRISWNNGDKDEPTSQSSSTKPVEQNPPDINPQPEKIEQKTLCKKSKDGVMTACIGGGVAADAEGSITFDNPTLMYGTTTAFENVANWKVVDGKGTVISQGFYTVASPDVGIPGPFSAWLFYDATPKTASGTLMVYEASAKDGEPIHEVVFPVTFLYKIGKLNGCDELSGSKIVVYWSNMQKQKNEYDCEEVFPVTHTVCGDSSANQLIAVHELLKGPTAWEKTKGYTTNIPEGLTTPNIHHNAQGKFLDFSSGFEGVSGSCRVKAIRAQFEKTVEAGIGIGVRGDTNVILQP